MPFTPVHTLLGASLLSLSTTNLLTSTGRVFGVSGIVDGALLGDHALWRWAIILGLLAGPTIGDLVGFGDRYASDAMIGWRGISVPRALLAGTLVGFGSKLGSGCTSGHFLCGVSRRSSRSIIATFTFFSIALLTANLVPPPPMPTSLASRLASSLKKPQPKDLPIMLIPALAVANIVIRQLLEAPNQKAKQNPAAIPPLPLRLAPYFLAGVTFSLGLLVSGMADPQKVLGFLLPTHADRFDPSMLMVVLGGVIPNAIHWALMSKGKPQLAWEKWSVPNRTLVDWRLLAGAVVFGMGWGLAGVCPGPVMVGVGRVLLGLSKGEPLGGVANPVFGFTMAMFAGMGLAGFV